MPTSRGDSRVLVSDAEGLAAWCDQALTGRHLALSVETNAASAYRPEARWIATVVADTVALIDVQAFSGQPAGLLRTALNAVARSTPVLVHGGSHALTALRVAFGFDAVTLWDSHEAAILLGLGQTGLRALVQELLGATLPPPYSGGWNVRPLPPAAVDAAAHRVLWLAPLDEVLKQRIHQADLDEEWRLASHAAATRRGGRNTPEPGRSAHMEGAAHLPPRARRILEALVQWRDARARERNLPPGRIITNAVLVAWAREPERTLETLNTATPRFHSHLMHADREQLARVVRLALLTPADPAAPVEERLGKGAPDAATRARRKALKRWRAEEAQRRGIGHAGVLPLDALEHLAFYPETPWDAVPNLGTSRAARYGEALRALVRRGRR